MDWNWKGAYCSDWKHKQNENKTKTKREKNIKKKVIQFKIGTKPFNWQWIDIKLFNWIFRTHLQCSSKLFSFTADDEHCICVQNIQLNNFYTYSLSIKRFHPNFELFYFRHGKAVWSSKLSTSRREKRG